LLVRKLRAATAEGERHIADENEQRGKADPLSDRRRVTSAGVTTSYLLRRLARSRPDLLAAYERGEILVNSRFG
jgi:hypothetical protein